MARCLPALVLMLGVWLFPGQVEACSLCESVIKKETLRQEFERAKIVLYGFASNPQFNNQPGAVAGSGTTDFHIEKVLKTDPFLGKERVLQLARYLPVADPKNPPHYLIFCDVFMNKLDPYHGRAIASPKILDYVEAARSLHGKDRSQALEFYAQHLDSSDSAIAEDAFMEFVKSNDEEVGKAAKRLSPERLRGLLKNATDPERAGLFAFLLGASGGDRDAEVLRRMIERPTPEMRKALDGMLCGYITLRPKEGWAAARTIVTDRKQDFATRFAALRACRFQYNWKPKESRAEIVRIFQDLVADPEIADLAIEELRRWEIRDLTPTIVACYDKASHDAPITRRTIVRYALGGTEPQARQFIQRLRQSDPELVRDLEEALMFEKGK